MSRKKRLGKPRIGRLLYTVLILNLSIFAVDHLRRDLGIIPACTLYHDKGIKNEQTVVGHDDPYHLGNEPQTTTETRGVEYIGFYEYYILQSQESTGPLVLADAQHRAVPLPKEDTVDLKKYKNDFYDVLNDSVRLDKDAAASLNAMMNDYNDATGLSDFIVYGTTETFTGEGSFCPGEFPDTPTGYTVDLALKGGGSVLTYDGLDEESWIVDNCWKYGFIVRSPMNKSHRTGMDYCPWHLRYVGDVHAAIMKERGFCLEEYIDFIAGFTFDAPFAYDLDGTNYEIYTVVSTGDMTSARVPISGNFDISGTYRDSYIITTVK